MPETLASLVHEYEDYSRALLACDPSVDEDALLAFVEIQEWGERIHNNARRLGFSWEDIENASDL